MKTDLPSVNTDPSDDEWWRMTVSSTPGRVFSTLLGAASAQGRRCVADRERLSIVVTPARTSREPVAALRLRVLPVEHGAIVTLASDAGPTPGDASMAAQAEVVGSLIHQLRRHLREQAA